MEQICDVNGMIGVDDGSGVNGTKKGEKGAEQISSTKGKKT